MESKNRKTKKKRHSHGMPVINPYAAGIDVGDIDMEVAISDGVTGFEVRTYRSFTDDLKNLVSWLKSKSISTVAMESTGIYWLNLYLMLEEEGIEPYLVNARHVKNVTGRKKDDTDAIWLQKLHCCGLLQKSFQPDGEIRTLRTYVRQRKNLISISSDSVRRMQKALELMNIKIHTVISDILGKTGMNMIEAILSGVRDPDELIKHKISRIKASDEEIRKSLVGIWKEEYLFMLKQAYDEYNFYQAQVADCDCKIQQSLLKQVAKVIDGDISDLDCKKKRKLQKNESIFVIRPLLKIIAGIDLCDVEGFNETTSLYMLSEIGTDMSKWHNKNCFAAWLNVAPNTKITGGKIISSKMQKKKNHAGQVFRIVAHSCKSSKSPMGDYARKMRSRLGKKSGNVATAHKLANIIYSLLKNKCPYDPLIIRSSEQKSKEKRIAYLEKQLKKLKEAS
jgi:transposase